MKCLCNYEFERDYINGNKSADFITKGDEDFIPLTQHFYIEDADNGHRDKKVRLFACPKCRTVQMEE